MRTFICHRVIASRQSKYSEHSNPKFILRSIQNKKSGVVNLNRSNRVHFYVKDSQN
jgi:hypothetical protein